MGIEHLFVQPVTVLHPTFVTDAYNNSIVNWDNPTATPTKGWLARTRSLEILDGRDALITDWQLYLPAGAEIEARDRVVAGDTTFEVVGPPLRAPTPRGIHHTEVLLNVVAG